MNEKELRKKLKAAGVEKGMISNILKPLREETGFKRIRPGWKFLATLEKMGIPVRAWIYIEKWLEKEEKKATEEGEQPIQTEKAS